MKNENENAGSTEETSVNLEAVQETPELTENENKDVLPTFDSMEVSEKEATKEKIETIENPTSDTEITTTENYVEESPEPLPKVEPTPEVSPTEETITKSFDETTNKEKAELGEATPSPEEHEEKVDYTTLNKIELTKALAELSNSEDGFRKGRTISAIKESYSTIFQKEREEALEEFIADGSEKDAFKLMLDEHSVKFEACSKILRDKKAKNAKEHERQKEKNLELKNALLKKLRAFIDDDENTSSINELKKMQEQWKVIGPVHNQHNRTLWANYNALMDLYYDHRSIYFELKELDRKKNLTAKQGLCEQAEALENFDNLNEAIEKLNDLHEEYKHIGPIPKEVQEETWQRFKAASDQVYVKRKDFVAHLKESLSENYTKKVEVANRISEAADFTSDKIADWNTKTKELLAIQKEWEAIGVMPKDQAKDINKKFWGSFKNFFHNKSVFFKTLDSQREENLKLKQALIDKAVELQNSKGWDTTANNYKALQREWKEIGSVPRKERENISAKFKASCDDFFSKKRDHSKGQESEFEENLLKKEEICKKIEALIGNEDLQPEQVYEFQDVFNSIGFVPKKAIKGIQNRYQAALNNIIDNAKDFDEEELAELKSLVKINKIKSDSHGDHKLQRKEHSIKRKIQNMEKNVSIWKNNLTFFSSSKNASEMLKTFKEKIQKAETELVELKEELKLITYAE